VYEIHFVFDTCILSPTKFHLKQNPLHLGSYSLPSKLELSTRLTSAITHHPETPKEIKTEAGTNRSIKTTQVQKDGYATVPAEIRKGHIPNTGLQRYL
jgi:hypothetical protein